MSSYLMLESPFTYADLQTFVNLAGKLGVGPTAEILETERGLAIPVKVRKVRVPATPVGTKPPVMRPARRARK